MKLIFVSFLFTFIFLFQPLLAQQKSSAQLLALQELNRRGEVYLSFLRNDTIQLSQLTRFLSISNVIDNHVFAYANAKEFALFQALNIDFKVEQAPSEGQKVAMADNASRILSWDVYPTYDAYEALMNKFETEHSDICQLLTIAVLPSGHKILAIKITDNPTKQEPEPEFLYTSSIHGDETAGYIMMLHLIDYLVTEYGNNNRITDIIDNTEIVICPLANPDGTYRSGNNTVNGATRYNANNVDLNRNYPDPKVGQHADGNAWQPETIAFMNFADEHHFTMGANFHGGSQVFNYPWDTWSRLTADNAWWFYQGRRYADTVHTHSPSGYLTDLNNGVTDGYAWYEINGGRQDYMNYFKNCRETTIELSYTKLLPENQLLNYWNYNYRSLINQLEEANFGLHGIISDSLTGAPLNARVYIAGFDKDSSQVYTDPVIGDYHRLLKGGNYSVTYSASGYQSKTIAVTIIDQKKTILDVMLTKGILGIRENEAEKIKIFPNPVTNRSLTIRMPAEINKITVKEIAGKVVYEDEPKNTEYVLRCNFPPGIYLLRIETKSSITERKIIIAD